MSLHPETSAVTAGRPEAAPDASLNPPIISSSTYHAGGPVGYGRYGNDSWSALETAIGELEGGATLSFSSGMAAISAVFSILPIGAPVVASNQGYSGVMSLLNQFHASGRLEVRFVEITHTEEVIAAMKGAALVWLESPTNPCLDVADLPTLIAAAKKLGIGVGIDNTFATPLVQ
jgi:cystathionine gamma-synthase